MLLSDSEIEETLNNPENLVNKFNPAKVLPVIKGGLTEGSKHIPPRVQELIGVLGSVSDEEQKDIGAVFGVSQATVSVSSRGMVGSGNTRRDSNIESAIDKVKHNGKIRDAHELALDAMLDTLHGLRSKLAAGDDHLKNAGKLSRIASDMSRVVGNLTPKSDPSVTNNTQVVLFAPAMKKERDYETIEA